MPTLTDVLDASTRAISSRRRGRHRSPPPFACANGWRVGGWRWSAAGGNISPAQLADVLAFEVAGRVPEVT